VDSWELTLRRSFRPWWGLGIIVRWHEIALSREGLEKDVLAGLAELQAEFPEWELELRRAA
jgi:hypothetical protein